MAMAIRLFRKKDESDRKIKIPEGRWIKGDACLEIIYKPEVERNLNVCPKCVYHFRIPARERIRAVIDEGSFAEFAEEMESVDVLNFTDTKKYVDRLKEAKKKTGRKEAVITGKGKIRGVGGALAGAAGVRGDVITPGRGALVGFAGPRVIEQTIQQKLPEGFQRAEFLLEHGMLDMIVERSRLKATLSQILRHLSDTGG